MKVKQTTTMGFYTSFSTSFAPGFIFHRIDFHFAHLGPVGAGIAVALHIRLEARAQKKGDVYANISRRDLVGM